MRHRDVVRLFFVAAAFLASSTAAEKSEVITPSFPTSVQSISADRNLRFLRGGSTVNKNIEDRGLGVHSIPGFEKFTNLLKTKITPDTLMKWFNKGKSPDYAFLKFKLNKAGIKLFDNPDINLWATYTATVVKSNPEAAMLTTLKGHYTDDVLWKMIDAAKKAESTTTTSLAIKLQAQQIEDWLANKKTPDYVFKIMLFNKDPGGILGDHQLTTWIDYMKRYNANPENKKNRASLIATLTTHYKDQGVLDIIAAAKKVQSTALPAKKLEAEQVQLWLREKRTPDEIFTVLSLDKAGDQLLATSEFKTWSKFINYYNKENPDQATTVIGKLMEQFDDETLTPILVAAREVESTKDIAAKLQVGQFKSWLGTDKDPDEVFKLLQLDKAPDNLLANQQLINWLTYVKDLNLKPANNKQQVSTITVLRDNFNDDVLANIIVAGKQISSRKVMAQRLEDDLFRGWMTSLNTPDDVFMHLKLNEAGEKVFESPLWNMYTSFLERFNKVDPERETTMISALARSYDDEALAKILIAAKKVSKTEELATKLQKNQIERWLDDKDPPDEIFKALSLDGEVDDLLTNPLLKTWTTYLDEFNAKFPSEKVSMIDTLRIHFDDEPLTYMLLAAKKVPSTETRATQLYEDQLHRWLTNKDTPEDVFRALRLDEAVDDVLDNPLLNTWSTYLIDFNAKFPRAKVSMIDTLREFFGDKAMVKMLIAAKEVDSTKKAATHLEAALANKWVLAKKTPAGVKKMVGTDAGSEKFLASYTTRFKETYGNVRFARF